MAAAEVQRVIGAVADADIDDDTEVEYIVAVDFTARLAVARLQASWSGTHNADVTAELRVIKSELAEWGETLRDEASLLYVGSISASERSKLATTIEKLFPAAKEDITGVEIIV